MNKVAVIAILVENYDSVERVNALLHDFRDYIVGRLGIPYKTRNVSVISVVLDATAEIINSLSGKLGMIDGVSAKVLQTK
ncbi:MAG: iron-only hydrogenase system regulator [Clostridiales bacterium]|nr:iron-only hydrogenase system regulator [Clostridiales bacterium]